MKKLVLFCLLFLSFIGISAHADTFDAAAKHAIAVDADSGKILYEKDATTPAGIASITKTLTVYLTYKAIQEGKLSWDTKVHISDYAYDLTKNYEASNVPMDKRTYTVRQLVNAAMIASANSAAIALAEKIGGSEPKFVDMMQKQLKEWGIQDATIVNASGLNNSVLGDNIYPGSKTSDENQMSALDVAIIARHLITDYPDVLKITSKTTADFDGTTMYTYNEMLKNESYYRQGVDGLKTGTTELAGACFVATSNENNMRIITVILNADNSDSDDDARFQATNDLLNYVDHHFTKVRVLKKGETLKKKKAIVTDGKEKWVKVRAKKAFDVIVETQKVDKIKTKFKSNKSGYPAPVEKGEEVGELIYKDVNLIGTGYLDGKLPRVSLTAKTSIKRSILPKVWWNHFVQYVNDNL